MIKKTYLENVKNIIDFYQIKEDKKFRKELAEIINFSYKRDLPPEEFNEIFKELIIKHSKFSEEEIFSKVKVILDEI